MLQIFAEVILWEFDNTVYPFAPVE